MSEPRAGEGLRALGSHVQGSRLLCSHEAASASSTEGPCTSHTAQIGGSGLPATREEI